jgi:Ca2+-binding EF-hand superfamily protein
VTWGQDEQPQRPAAQEQPKQFKKKNFDRAAMFEKLDANRDGFLQRDELPERARERFEQIDANRDGKLSREEFVRFAGGAPLAAGQSPEGAPDVLFKLLDANNDGKLSKDELQNAARLLEKLDTNKDGVIDQADLKAYAQRPDSKGVPKKQGGRPGEVVTPAAKGERQKDTLKVGDPAPDFTLPDLKGTREITLSSFKGKKPVVLIFASYT